MSSQESRWRPPRLQEVAARAGVSKATVSNALNGTGRLSEPTRQRVMAAVRELGHVPASASRARGRGQTGLLGLSLGTFGESPVVYPEVPYYGQLTLAAITEATRHGYLLTVLPSSMSSWAWLTVPVDGVIHNEPTEADPVRAALQQRGIPVVHDGRPVDPRPGDAWVDNDHAATTVMLLEHLQAYGSRRVGVVLPRHADAYPQLVRDAYLAWCAGRQPAMVAQFDPIPDYLATEEAAAYELLSRPDRPDAVFGIYNDSGRTALAAAARLGLRVPTDLRIACFSEDPAYEHTSPPVTTVSLQPQLIAAEAVDLLVAIVNGRRGVRRQRLVPTCLHERESTRGPG